MFKNRFILVVGVLALLLVATAVSRPVSNAAVFNAQGANDFYQRHRNWNRNLEGSDYYERHFELSGPSASADAASDFALRHPEWTVSVQNAPIYVIDNSVTDYFQRHPELSSPAAITIDRSDYFARHPELRLPANLIDTSDYFLRH